MVKRKKREEKFKRKFETIQKRKRERDVEIAGNKIVLENANYAIIKRIRKFLILMICLWLVVITF